MSECVLREVELPPTASPELREMVELARRHGLRTFEHVELGEAFKGRRAVVKTLTVTLTLDVYTLEEAHTAMLGIRRWRHVAVGVRGSLQARLADQQAIGRKRAGGERSPAPLPDWYDLTHIAYSHPELGFDSTRAVWQYLPPTSEPYLNIAEALHLCQPA